MMQSLSSELSHFNVPHRSDDEHDISSRMKISPKTHFSGHDGPEAYQSRKFLKDFIRNTLSSIIIGVIVILPVQPSSQLGIHTPLYAAPALASESKHRPTGMACVSQSCSRQLSECLADSNCAKGLGCFSRCAAKDAYDKIRSNRKDVDARIEGSCQVRCMDLYQNERLDDFTDCTLTKNRCYDVLKADARYPKLPFEVWDERLKESRASAENKLKQLFRGTWYISAGLNPAFDLFDCQVHTFYAEKGVADVTSIANIQQQQTQASIDRIAVIADANFAYRIKSEVAEKYFTKTGIKRLALVETSSAEEFPAKSKPKTVAFQKGKKWGIDAFHTTSQQGENLNEEKALKPEWQPYKLLLTLTPSSMNYEDEWTLLSFSDDPRYGFIVLAYQGANAAWEGYGGLNIYTRNPMTIGSLFNSKNEEEKKMFYNMQFALEKIGLSIDDLVEVNY